MFFRAGCPSAFERALGQFSRILLYLQSASIDQNRKRLSQELKRVFVKKIKPLKILNKNVVRKIIRTN